LTGRNTFIAGVVKAGVRVFLYHKGHLHTETISVDSKIGSTIIDICSFSINYETNAIYTSLGSSNRLSMTLSGT
jgi:cardiolipin synthase